MFNPSDFLRHWERIAAMKLWDGFEPRSVEVMVFDGVATFTFNTARGLAGFAAEGEWQRMEGRFEALTANTTLGETATVIVNGNAEDASLEAAIIGAHEAFHVFQAGRYPSWGANEAGAFSYPMEDSEALTMRRLETRALYRAIETLDAGWALEALRWRDRRFARLPPSAVMYERELERFEGSAFFVELKARGMQHRLPEADFPIGSVRPRAYATGQVMLRLLEVWQPNLLAELETAYPDELLRRCGSKLNAAQRTLEETLETVEAERAMREVRALEEERDNARLEFQNSAAVMLEVESKSALWLQGFDPMNVKRLSETEVLHGRFLELGNAAGSMRMLGVESLTVAAGAHPLMEGVRSVWIALSGAPEVTTMNETLELNGDGFSLKLSGASLEQDSAQHSVSWRITIP